MSALALDSIKHSFPGRERILNGVSLTVAKGERVAILGPSGSGKSTLLHIAGLIARSDSGSVTIGGQFIVHDSATANVVARNLLRSRIGWLTQQLNLIGAFTAQENVTLALDITGMGQSESMDLAATTLEKVGLGDRCHVRASRLSGGEQHRVSLARCIARPGIQLIIADEPTASLDAANSRAILATIADAVGRDTALLLATHDHRAAQFCNRRLVLEMGTLRAANDLDITP